MRILIVGAGGQDGSLLAERCLAQGHEVLGVSSNSQVPGSNGIELIDVDLANSEKSKSLFQFFKPDRIFHLAAVHSSSALTEVNLERTQEKIYSCNLVITQNILDWQRSNLDCRSVIGLSSQMYSFEKSGRYIDETSILDPRNYYGKTKAEAFSLLRNYRSKYGTHSFGAILFNHTSNRSKSEFLFPQLVFSILQVINGKSSKIVVRDPNAELDICDAGEVCAGLSKMAELDVPTDIIFASGVAINIRDLISKTMKNLSFSRDYMIERDVVDFSSAPALIGNPSKALNLLNWKALNSAEEILLRMINENRI
jgi:GDPmannose 4,6-dehydratase